MRAFLTALLGMACGLAGAQTAVPFKVKTMDGVMPHAQKFTVYILHSEADWNRYWSSVLMDGATDAQGRPVPPKPSGEDWKSTELVAVHLGSRPNGPYNVQVSSVAKDKGAYDITVTEQPPRGMAFMHVTYPFVIVELPAGVEKANVNVQKGQAAPGARHGRVLAPNGGGG